MNIATLPAALAGVSEEEWQIRCDLAALYRLVAHHRWTDFVYTHLSARLPGPHHHFLINKFGVLFHEMRASDLVKIDLHGNVVEEGDTTSGRIAYHGFEGIALDLDERDRLVNDLGPEHKAMILRNHGLLVGGSSIPEAFHMIYMLERACAAQIAALSCGREIVLPPEEVCGHTSAQFHGMETDEHYGWMWQTALRLIENDRPDYRT